MKMREMVQAYIDGLLAGHLRCETRREIRQEMRRWAVERTGDPKVQNRIVQIFDEWEPDQPGTYHLTGS